MNKSFDNSLKLIAKSSIIVLMGVVLSKVFSYLYRLIIAREFGPEVYGLFSLSIMLLGWVSIVAVFGLGEGVVRYISRFRGTKDAHEINYIFRKSLLFVLAAGIVGGAILFIFSSFISNSIFHEPGLEIFLKILSFIIPFSVASSILFSTLRAYEKIGWNIILSVVLTNVFNVGFILLLVFAGFGVISVPLSYLLGYFVVFVLSMIVLKKQVSGIYKKPRKKKRKIFREVLSFSWPLLFAGLVQRIFEWADSFFIGYFSTAQQVGIYNAAIPIAFLLFVSSELFMKLFYPIVNREYSQGDRETIKQLSQQVGKWVFIMNLPILILILVFPETFLNILFGPEYIAAASSLRILSIGSFFLSLFAISNKLISMVGKSKVMFLHVIIVGAVNIILNILLIPKYGIVGAAISTAFSFILMSIISTAQIFYYIRIFPLRRKVVTVMFCGIISMGFLLFAKALLPSNLLSFFILALFFMLLYFLFIFLFKALDRHDMMIIKSFFRRQKA